ncbi:MAG: DNA repair protein RecO [Candidatus Pacebacteria bacterium]|nr:DNA repair protein RecO [Candidatus Paceibacterota bacterium]
MHHIYHTEGIILGSKNFKEASKYFYILTRDLGLVYAEAQGIRKISSKLRFVLQDFNYLKLDFVQRKNIWRITNAIKTNELENLNKDFYKLKIVANISKLLLRLLPGIEPNPTLFEEVVNGFFLLEKNNSKEELKNIEIVLVLRILSNLGYIGENFEDLTRSPFENELLGILSQNKVKIIKEINKALRETQL